MPINTLKDVKQQNGTSVPTRTLSVNLVKDHLELAALEWGVEKQEGQRRLIIFVSSAILITASFVYFQIALIGWFLKMGFGLASLGLLLGFVFLTAGLLMIRFFGKRSESLGKPFQSSLFELKRSIKWIEKLLF